MEKVEPQEIVDLKTVAKLYGYANYRSVRRLALRGEVPGAFQIPKNSKKGHWKVDLKILRKAWNGNGNGHAS